MLRLFAVILVCCLLAGPALADRLILTPTGHTLGTGIKAEYAANSDNDGRIYWAQVGLTKVEVEGARFQDFAPDNVDVISAQIEAMPETSFTPSIALGVRDISDESKGQGALYDGRTFYVAATKAVPVTGGIPLLFKDMKIHGGFGTGGSLSGFFFGVSGKLPMGIGVVGEFDTDDWNFAASYNIVPMLKVQVSSIKGDIYYGASFSASL